MRKRSTTEQRANETTLAAATAPRSWHMGGRQRPQVLLTSKPVRQVTMTYSIRVVDGSLQLEMI